MGCEGNVIQEIENNGVTVVLEAWHYTDEDDPDTSACLACDTGSADFGWYVLSRIVQSAGRPEMKCLTEEPLGERPDVETMRRVASLLASENEEGLYKLLEELP